MVSSMVSGQLDRFDGKNHGFRCRFSPTNQSIDRMVNLGCASNVVVMIGFMYPLVMTNIASGLP